MNALTLNVHATKTMHCPGCRSTQTFEVNAKAWYCCGCGWVKEFSKDDLKKVMFHSPTKELSDYLVSIGYPVVDTVLEVPDSSGLMAGTIVLIDTNPKRDPKVNRRVLEIDVETFDKSVSHQVNAIKYTTGGRKTGHTRASYGDLTALDSDTELRMNVAQLVVEDLGLKLQNPLFDYMGMCLELDVEDAEHELAERKAALAKHKEARKNQA